MNKLVFFFRVTYGATTWEGHMWGGRTQVLDHRPTLIFINRKFTLLLQNKQEETVETATKGEFYCMI